MAMAMAMAMGPPPHPMTSKTLGYQLRSPRHSAMHPLQRSQPQAIVSYQPHQQQYLHQTQHDGAGDTTESNP